MEQKSPLEVQTSSTTFDNCSRGSCGGVSFYDGHVEMIPVAMRNKGTYINSGLSAHVASTYQHLHLGELVPPWMRITETSSAAYLKEAPLSYDYYFWVSKDLKR